MRAEILEDMAEGHLSSKLRRLIFIRVVKFIVVCLILILLFWLILAEDYSSLFFLIGGVAGFLSFLALRFLENRFMKNQNKEDSQSSPEIRKLAELKEIKPKSSVKE